MHEAAVAAEQLLRDLLLPRHVELEDDERLRPPPRQLPHVRLVRRAHAVFGEHLDRRLVSVDDGTIENALVHKADERP